MEVLNSLAVIANIIIAIILWRKESRIEREKIVLRRSSEQIEKYFDWLAEILNHVEKFIIGYAHANRIDWILRKNKVITTVYSGDDVGKIIINNRQLLIEHGFNLPNDTTAIKSSIQHYIDYLAVRAEVANKLEIKTQYLSLARVYLGKHVEELTEDILELVLNLPSIQGNSYTENQQRRINDFEIIHAKYNQILEVTKKII